MGERTEIVPDGARIGVESTSFDLPVGGMCTDSLIPRAPMFVPPRMTLSDQKIMDDIGMYGISSPSSQSKSFEEGGSDMVRAVLLPDFDF